MIKTKTLAMRKSLILKGMGVRSTLFITIGD